MKAKWYIIGVLISSGIVYLEWGNNQQFLIEIELELIEKLWSDPLSVFHPFTIIPLLGQVLLVVGLFQKNPSSKLLIAGISCLTLLIGFILLAGILASNIYIVFSTIPFLVLSFLTIRQIRMKAKS